MSSPSGMIAQLRLPAPATVTLGSVSKNVCGASARLRVMKVLKTLGFLAVFDSSLQRDTKSCRSLSSAPGMIMFQGHCDTSMIKTFQLNAHIQFLHSLLIL